MKAAGILFIANGKVLLLKRIDGYWGLPGGHIEPGETAEEAAIRETWEECQYRVRHPLKRYAEAVSPQVTFTTFLCRVPDEFKPVLNHEHTGYLWTSRVPNRTHPMLIQILQGLLMEKTYTSEFLKRFDVAKMKRLGYLVCSDVKNPEGTYTVVYRKRTGDASPESLEKKIAELNGSLGLAREKRRMKTGGAQHYQSQREMDLSRRISELRTELHNLRSSKDAIEGIVYKTLAEAKVAAERTGGKVEQKFDTSKEPPYNTYWVVKPATKDVFKEEEHPREGGKFTSKGGSSKGGEKKSSGGEVTEASVKSATNEYNQALAEYRQAHQKMEGALQEAAKGFSSNSNERWNQIVKFKKDYLKPHEQKLNKAEKKANEAITALSKADGKNRPLVGFKGTPGGRFG